MKSKESELGATIHNRYIIDIIIMFVHYCSSGIRSVMVTLLGCCWRSCGRCVLRLGMLNRVTSGLSGAGGVAYHTDADFFISSLQGECWRCGCWWGSFNSWPRVCATEPAHDVAPPAIGKEAEDDDHWPDWYWCSPRRNSSMSARNVLWRSGSLNGNDDACSKGDRVGDGGCFSRRLHTSFMAHCRFCLLTKDSGLAVVPIGELWTILHGTIVYTFIRLWLC